MNDLVLKEVDAALDRSGTASMGLIRQIDAWDVGGHIWLAQAGLDLLAQVTPRLSLLGHVRDACLGDAPDSVTSGDLARDALIEAHTLSARIERILFDASDHDLSTASV